jgi:hypothetical protein
MLDSRYSDASAKAKVVPKPGITREFGRLEPTCGYCGRPVGPDDFLTYYPRKKQISFVCHKGECDVFPRNYSRQLDQVFDFGSRGQNV